MHVQASEETQMVVRKILQDMLPLLDERQRRALCGSVASALGHYV